MPEVVTLETARPVPPPFTLAGTAHLRGSTTAGSAIQVPGVTRDARQREHFLRDGHPDDIEAYGMLRAESRQVRSANPPAKPQA